ncbi:MAG: heme-binding domain-containing protein [Bacteroidota bacterium]
METRDDKVTEKSVKRKRRWPKTILLILFFIFLIIQFFQPDKNNNSITATNDIHAMVSVPDSVQQLLKMACYDCHSNNTNYPWYTNIQPIGWWLNDHIEEGKQHLNFNEFVNIPPLNGKTTRERQLKKLEEVKETIEEGEMPLTSYTFIHKEAKLSPAQKQLIIDWSENALRTISSAK